MTNSGFASLRTVARRRAAAAVLAALVAIAGPPPAGAESASPPSGFELSRGVQLSLVRLQELWLQWVSATLQDNRNRADETLRSLTSAAREVGFLYLPDLALGAAAQARASAEAGRFDRAALQLEAAELLDPGRPETSFAAAAVARARGDWGSAFFSVGQGMARTWRAPEGWQARASVLLWLLVVLLAAAVLFILLAIALHGWAAARALREWLAISLPGSLASILALLVLVGPLALPAGPYLFLLVWSALLWTFLRRSERAVLIAAWTLAAIAGPIAERVEASLALAQSPPMRAWSAFEQGRLYGSFFSDVQVLRAALADEPAALEFVADVHRTLGQWDLARTYYRRVLLERPDNIPVLINLGAFYFRKGDLALANAYFERATRTPVPSAAAWYDLSLGYSDAYLFDDSKVALGKAREIDGSAVDAWIATSNPDRVLTFNGSLASLGKVRAALLRAWRDAGEEKEAVRHTGWGAVAALVTLLVALAFDRLRRRRGMQATPVAVLPAAGSRAGRWLRVFVPALPAAEAGEGPLAYAHLAVPTALLLLPSAFRLGGDLPLPGWPGSSLLDSIAILLALVYLALLARRLVSRAED